MGWIGLGLGSSSVPKKYLHLFQPDRMWRIANTLLCLKVGYWMGCGDFSVRVITAEKYLPYHY